MVPGWLLKLDEFRYELVESAPLEEVQIDGNLVHKMEISYPLNIPYQPHNFLRLYIPNR